MSRIKELYLPRDYENPIMARILEDEARRERQRIVTLRVTLCMFPVALMAGVAFYYFVFFT